MKMMKIELIFIFIIAFCYGAIDKDHQLCREHYAGGIAPKVIDAPKKEAIIGLCKNNYLAIDYNTFTRTPIWVAYKLTSYNMKRASGTRRSFSLDDDLKNHGLNQADPKSDCFNQVYTRGHLAPSRAFSWDKSKGGPHEMVYYMSNIAPQIGKFNSGSWNQMETKVFEYVKKQPDGYELYIVNGVAFNSSYTTRSGVAVPSYFYHVMCDTQNGKSAGFYARNSEESEKTKEVAKFRTVREVEEFVKVNFNFPAACNPSVVNPGDWW